jgi:acylphosphatase
MKKRIIIRGKKVHEVGYRPLLLGIAESLEMERFFAENIFIDGTQAVEVLAEDEGDKVTVFLDLVEKRRPEGAEVEKIEVYDYNGSVMRAESYYRYLTSTQLSKMAEYGGKMIERQEETTKEIRDFRGEFNDYSREFGDFAGRTDKSFMILFEKYGEISEKLTFSLETLRAESAETRKILAEAIGHLMKDSAETKAELKRSVDNLVKLIERFLEKA